VIRLLLCALLKRDAEKIAKTAQPSRWTIYDPSASNVRGRSRKSRNGVKDSGTFDPLPRLGIGIEAFFPLHRISRTPHRGPLPFLLFWISSTFSYVPIFVFGIHLQYIAALETYHHRLVHRRFET